jgi:ribonuclease HII
MEKSLFNIKKDINYGENLAKFYGYKNIIGIDEAGRGPLAGPVVVAGVFLENIGEWASELNDSKKLSLKKRNELYHLIKNNSIYEISVISPKVIDELNILQATKKGMLEVAKSILKRKNNINVVLIDGNQKIDCRKIPQITIVKGDSLSKSIAAASILAKVTRDEIMLNYSKKYPQYGFENHKGYPTKKHILAIKKYGITDIHRKTFKPIKNILEN